MTEKVPVQEYSSLILERSTLAQLVAGLPPIDLRKKLRGEAEYYGASSLISDKIGLLQTPHTKVKWSHGWKFMPVEFACELGNYKDSERNYLVSSVDHQKVLGREGFSNVHLTGMPFIYTPVFEEERPIERSLLVCPGHVGNFSKAAWGAFSEEYATKIEKLKGEFDEILVCLSASCVESGNWKDAFESRGIPWVLGASIYDRNALPRMRRLFSSFAYMTSNTMGSHLAYAAYCGSRVSICGWQDLYTEEILNDEPYYKKYPEVLRKVLDFMQEDILSERFPFLFVDTPLHAKQNVEWAQVELGEKYKKQPEEMADLLGWRPYEIDKLKPNNYTPATRLKHLGPPGKGLRGSIKKRLWKRERVALKRLPRFVGGHVGLLGKPFRYVDARSAMHAIDHIFNKEAYAFDSDKDSPLIIDAGANVGMGSLYFKQCYPKARLVCFEPDPEVFLALSQNARTYGWSDCELIRAALWKQEGNVEFMAEGADSGAVDFGQGCDGKRYIVPTKRLSGWLTGETVDFLKIDIEGAEVEVLDECSEHLSAVQRIFVEYHSFSGRPQRLGEMFDILEHAGFRVHVAYAGLLRIEASYQ